MTKKKKIKESMYNPALLRQLCEAGADAQTAKKELGLASLQSLRTHLMRLSVESQELMTLPGLYERCSTNVRLTKHGLKLSNSKLKAAEIDYPLQTEFHMVFDADTEQIILTKIGASSGLDDEEES